jgi:hypothetical protein
MCGTTRPTSRYDTIRYDNDGRYRKTVCIVFSSLHRTRYGITLGTALQRHGVAAAWRRGALNRRAPWRRHHGGSTGMDQQTTTLAQHRHICGGWGCGGGGVLTSSASRKASRKKRSDGPARVKGLMRAIARGSARARERVRAREARKRSLWKRGA